MEPYVLGLIIAGLAAVAWLFIREWKETWENRVIAHDSRLNEHDTKLTEQAVLNATVSANIEHIRETSDETRKDVKQLLKQNGHRSTG